MNKEIIEVRIQTNDNYLNTWEEIVPFDMYISEDDNLILVWEAFSQYLFGFREIRWNYRGSDQGYYWRL